MDPAKMKVVDLRSELGALGLDTKGNKPALVERLKKALESKTGKVIADTTILDTSTEDVEDTPRKPAARTTRRSSSSRLAATPVKKIIREEPPKVIEEDKETQEEEKVEKEEIEEKKVEEDDQDEKNDKPEEIQPANKESQSPDPTPDSNEEPAESMETDDVQQPSKTKDTSETYNPEEPTKMETNDEQEPAPAKNNEDVEKKENEQDGENKRDKPPRQLTEEEEWAELNKRLQQKEQERLEREKKQKEEDEKKLEEFSNDPIKLQRLKRKHEKKARWNNYYRTIETTNKVLTPPSPLTGKKKKTEPVVETKVEEPQLDDNKVTLSWYDSDLNQYLELPELNSVVPLSEGAFAHAWAGARASHGVAEGRVCYEVRVGAVVTTTEATDKEQILNGLRIGWSTDDSSLHLGEGPLSFGYESTARAVNNGEFKEYGQTYTEKDVVGVYLDLESEPCTISYTLNGVTLGTAYEFPKESLAGRALFPHVLTKNTCYRVNMGYDRYNMLTKTKIVRKRVEVPIEKILEERRLKLEELKKQRQEQARINRERKEKEKQEREERQRKKKEERDKQDKERKERDAERRERGEMEVDEKDKEETDKDEKDKDESVDKSMEEDAEDKKEDKDESMENGDKLQEEAVPEVKEEPSSPKPDEQAEKTDDKTEVKTEKTNPTEITEEEFNKGPVLDKRIKFVIRYTVDEELDGAEACLQPGYVLLTAGELVPGPRRPPTTQDCEVILMVGMPGSGKTYWARQHAAANPDKRYNIISTGALFDRMKVDCKPIRASYEGRWDAMVSKCAKCVVKLLEIAKGRRRNFILDQTNVYPSAQRRKLREFDGYRRVAVVVVTDAETYADRCRRREEADGKEVPDGAIVDMKANFTLPEPSSWLDEVIYAELDAEKAKEIIETYHQEAAASGAARERDRRARSDSREGPPNKRARSPDRRDRRPRDREDRWGGGNSRWGPASGGRGGRWGGSGGGGGGRDRSGGGGGGGGGRFDRWSGPGNNRNDYGRDRDSFRGGRGGRGGGGMGDRGRGGGGGGMGDRYRDSRPGRGPSAEGRGPPNKNQGGMGGAGSWQRGSAGGRAPGRPNQQGRQDGLQNKGSQNQGNQNAQNQQGWNQWANQWGGWGNWGNQQQGWGNWNNWGWGNAQGQGQGQQQQGQGKGQGQGQQNQQQWPANYTAQQWYQWQQWQQQQQGWPGYQQSGQANQGGQASGNDQAQAWAQYYQNYGGGNAANANAGAIDKK